MKRIATALGALCMLLAMFPSFAVAQDQKPEIAKTNLKVGDVAPDFTLLSDKWESVKLSDYRGKKTVILAFYVLAFTGG
jgi:cytochrome oxidase Cu insertion factor (SCO1/SenC/PrrC family)